MVNRVAVSRGRGSAPDRLSNLAAGGSSPRTARAVAGVGHEDQFPATSPSVGYLFGQETVARATPDGEVRREPPFGRPVANGLSRSNRSFTPREDSAPRDQN